MSLKRLQLEHQRTRGLNRGLLNDPELDLTTTRRTTERAINTHLHKQRTHGEEKDEEMLRTIPKLSSASHGIVALNLMFVSECHRLINIDYVMLYLISVVDSADLKTHATGY